MKPSCPVCHRPFSLLRRPNPRSWRHVMDRVCPYCKASLRVAPSRGAQHLGLLLIGFAILIAPASYIGFRFAPRLHLSPDLAQAYFDLAQVLISLSCTAVGIYALRHPPHCVPRPSQPTPEEHPESPASRGTA